MLVITPARRQFGFGLVELMIGLLVGMIVVAAALSLLSTTMASSNDNIKMLRLDQELRQVMTMLTRDLRRATIWDPAVDVTRVSLAHPLKLSGNTGSVTVTSSSGNLDDIGAKAVGGTLVYTVQEDDPLTLVILFAPKVYKGLITAYNSGSKIYSVTISTAWPATVVPASSWSILRPESTITTDPTTGSGTCILFAYDTDASGTYTNYSASAPSTPNEFFGYRYDIPAKAVETRKSSAGTCAGGGGNWENLTDENTIKITNFSVTNNPHTALTSSGFSIDVRVFTISITGQLKSDPSVVRTLQETVRVRNDRLS